MSTKTIVPFVQREFNLANQTVKDPRSPEFMRSSGSVVGPKAFAERKGLNIETMSKDERKALMKELDVARGQQAQFVRQAVAVGLADARMGGTKFKFTTNKAGDLTGFDASFRINNKLANITLASENSKLKAELAAARQQLLALTPAATA